MWSDDALDKVENRREKGLGSRERELEMKLKCRSMALTGG